MSYLRDFLTQIKNRDFHKFLVLWEEYSSADSVETEEFSQLLKAIRTSDLAVHFGQIIETALPLWKTIQDQDESYEILKLLVDLQTANRPALAEVIVETLNRRYGDDPKFQENLRAIGMRDKDNLQGVLSRYDLLRHMNEGNIVFHTGGWGTGEIMEVSPIREHLVIEFENVSGRKDLSYNNAFKTLIPLPHTHFLARRFSDPDKLEKEGIENPIELVKLLLHDMGPQTAAEIKDELCELVISEKVWIKWWQGARAKIKKHALIETPDSLKEPFYLRKAELSADERLKQLMQNKKDTNQIIQITYSFVRDVSGALKNPTTKKTLQDQLLQLLESEETKEEYVLQIYLLLEQFFGYESATAQVKALIQSLEASQFETVIANVDIVAFKKRILLAIKDYRADSTAIFAHLIYLIPQVQLKDYLLKELNQPASQDILKEKIKDLVVHPVKSPETFVWYFQKIIAEDKDIPFSNHMGKEAFFESFFILLSEIEDSVNYRELAKKMYTMMLARRYELVRDFFKITNLEFAKEFLLLVSKCHSFTDHDLKILRSLAEVVHPSLALGKQKKDSDYAETTDIWTTQEGHQKIQERIRQIATVEVIENAREIEAARALGDLRENSEFKFAQERRARLQSEMKTLSDDLKNARIITPEDVTTKTIGIATIVEVEDSKDNKVTYSILGPWDANPDKNILSYNSKFALAMIGKKQGDIFEFRDEKYTILAINSFFNR